MSGALVNARWLYCELIWAGMSLTESNKRLRDSKPLCQSTLLFDPLITRDTVGIVTRFMVPSDIKQTKNDV